MMDEEWQKVIAIENERRERNHKEGKMKWSVDHIVPVKKAGLTVPWNLRLLPFSKNSSKKDKVDFSDPAVQSILEKDIEFLSRAEDSDTLALETLAIKKSQLRVA